MKQFLMILMLCLLLAGCTGAESVETAVPDVPPATVQLLPTQPAQAPTLPPAEIPTEIPEPEDSELVRVAAYVSGIRLDLRYAADGNFTGQPVYDFADAYLRYGTVRKLKQVCEELKARGLGILIWDAFRPQSAQEKLWQICPDPTYVSHPVTGSRSHCRGSAIDLTLVDLETGAQMVMPTDFDDFTALADRDYSDCPEEAEKNARLLEQVMEKHGFQPYSAEWWHFSDTDEYPVDEMFRPEQTVFDGGVG